MKNRHIIITAAIFGILASNAHAVDTQTVKIYHTAISWGLETASKNAGDYIGAGLIDKSVLLGYSGSDCEGVFVVQNKGSDKTSSIDINFKNISSVKISQAVTPDSIIKIEGGLCRKPAFSTENEPQACQNIITPFKQLNLAKWITEGMKQLAKACRE